MVYHCPFTHKSYGLYAGSIFFRLPSGVFFPSGLYQMTTVDLMFYKQEILSLLLSSTYINMFFHTDTPFYYKLFQIQ